MKKDLLLCTLIYSKSTVYFICILQVVPELCANKKNHGILPLQVTSSMKFCEGPPVHNMFSVIISFAVSGLILNIVLV